MRTELCDRFDLDVPIFAFSHCRDVVAAVTNAGGMGVLGALAFSAEQLEIELAWIDEHVDGKPYGVDIVMPAKYEGKDRGLGQKDEATGEVDPAVFQKLIPQETRDWIEKVLDEYDVPPFPPNHQPADGVGGRGSGGLLGWTEGGARSHVDVALKHPARLLVNALGPPPKDVIDLAHSRGVQVAALTGAVEHAVRQKEQGVDIVIAQGTEAGGHTGEIGSMVLIPDIVDAIRPTPVLGAGGIGSGRQAAAALALLGVAHRRGERDHGLPARQAARGGLEGRGPLAHAVGQARAHAADGVDGCVAAPGLPRHPPHAAPVHGLRGRQRTHRAGGASGGREGARPRRHAGGTDRQPHERGGDLGGGDLPLHGRVRRLRLAAPGDEAAEKHG
jgi:NAD(P)H-dependent flavin oxidoreductase YrpB (nitropropane dioxygenase family)